MDMRHATATVGLIRKHGLYGLSGDEGCECYSFQVQGIFVDVSCHRSEHSIRVYSHHLCSDPLGLEMVAKEVISQLNKAESTMDTSYRLRFCEYSMDNHKQGSRCCYCAKPRVSKETYLCEACQQKKEALRSYPWTKDGFI